LPTESTDAKANQVKM
jgi:Zn-finger nucleic acid-binding protein